MPTVTEVLTSDLSGGWSHPVPGAALSITTIATGAGGGGASTGGGGGACAVRQSIISGDVYTQIGAGGSGGYNSYDTIWDTSLDPETSVVASSGIGSQYGGTGGQAGDCTFADSAFSGGLTVTITGGGAAGPGGNGAVGSVTGGAGGSNGAYPVSTHGAKGGDAGQAVADSPGAGASTGEDGINGAGGNGQIVLIYDLDAPTITSTPGGTGTTADVSIPSLATNVTLLSADLVPMFGAWTISGGANSNLFQLDGTGGDDERTLNLDFIETPDDGVYTVQVSAENRGGAGSQLLTITVGGSGGEEDLPAASGASKLLFFPAKASL